MVESNILRSSSSFSTSNKQTLIVKNNSSWQNHSIIMQVLSTTYSVTKPGMLKTFPHKKNHEIAKIPSNIYTLRQSDLVEKYRIEIGLRTAIILGSMVFFIVFYFLWHSIAKFISKRLRKPNNKKKKDFDLDYWLDYVDQRARRKAARKPILIIYSPKLPDLPYDSRITTQEWVKKHRTVWNNMQVNSQNYHTKWYHDAVLFEENYEIFNNEGSTDLNEASNPLVVKYNRSNLAGNFTYSPTLRKFKNMLMFKFKNKYQVNYKTVRRSVVYRELEANAQLIDNYYNETLQNFPRVLDGYKLIRRRHSWPKCNKDFLKLQSFDLVKN